MEEYTYRFLQAFEGNLRRLGRAEATQTKYVQHLSHFCVWLGERRPGELGPREFEEYLADWEAEFLAFNGRRPSTALMRLRITALRSFYAYLERTESLLDAEGKPVTNRAALLESPQRQAKAIDYLTPQEDAAILAFQGKPHEVFLVQLLRFTGLRVGEAVSVTVGDLTLTGQSQTLRVQFSKTPAGRRMIPLPPELLPRLDGWLRGLGNVRSTYPLLATSRGTAMYPSFVWRVVNRVGALANVRPIPCTCGNTTVYGHGEGCPRGFNGEHRSYLAPHTLRRTYATDLLNKSVPIMSVSKLLGHTSVAVTQQYYAELANATVFEDFYRAVGATAFNHRSELAWVA